MVHLPRRTYALLVIVILLSATFGCSGPTSATNPGGGTTPETHELTVAPGSVDFSDQQLSTKSGAKTVTISNPGTTAINVSSIAVTGDFAQTNDCGGTVAAAGSCAVSLTFTPSTTGSRTGDLQVSETSGKVHHVGVKGNGVPKTQLSTSVSSIDFGNVAVGQNSTQTVSMTNNGSASVTVSSVATAATGYSITGITLPLMLAAGASGNFTVKFSPTATGSSTGNISISSTASNPSLTISLSGTGASAGFLVSNTGVVNFGNVTLGQSSTQTLVLSNIGGVNLTISEATVGGNGFSISGLTVPLTLAPKEKSSFVIKFSPTGSGNVNGVVSLQNTGSTPKTNLALSGAGVAPSGQLSASTTSVNFGNVTLGQSNTQTVTLTNTGGASLTVSAAPITGNGFSLSGLTLPLTLAAGATSTFSVKFNPAASGGATGSISITNSASNQPLAINLSGTGVAPAQLSPSTTSLAFGSVNVGSSSSKTVTLTNTGGLSLNISNVSINGAGISTDLVTQTLAAGASKTFTVTFTPSSSGTLSGWIDITHSASTSALRVTLTGTAVAVNPVTHTVTLSWDQGPSTIAGYNIYRGTQNGGPYTKINSSLETSHLFTDPNVQNGTTYYYVVTAVDNSAVESDKCSSVAAVVPAQ